MNEAESKKNFDENEPLLVKSSKKQDPWSWMSQADIEKVSAELTNGFSKQASSSQMLMSSVPFVSKVPLLYVDPMFDPLLFLFPKDRLDEINKRLRHYYETDPIVGNVTDLHTEFPLSDFELKCEDPVIQQYYNDFKDRVNLLDLLKSMAHDYWLLGESFAYGNWDNINFEWSHFNQYPPENVDIFKTYVTPTAFFFLKPDPELQKKLSSSSPVDGALMKMMDSKYVDSVRSGKPFLLGSDKRVMYLSRTSAKYRHRGISLWIRALKDLLYQDKVRIQQLTFVDRHTFPLKIFKLGDPSKGWIPKKSHFTKLKQLLIQAKNDPDFDLIYHYGLEVDTVTGVDKIMNTAAEFEAIEKRLMIAGFVNEEILHGGVPSHVRDTVHLRTLMHRYLSFRDTMENMLLKLVFYPLAQSRGFYKKSYLSNTNVDKKIKVTTEDKRQIEVFGHQLDGKHYRVSNSVHAGADYSKYDMPRVIWRKMNLINNLAEQELLTRLRESGDVPLEMVLDVLGLDPKYTEKKRNAEYGTSADPLWRKIREEVAEDKDVGMQVFKGVKPEDLKFNKDTKEDEEKFDIPVNETPVNLKPLDQVAPSTPSSESQPMEPVPSATPATPPKEETAPAPAE